MISSGIFRRYEEIAGLADAAFRRLAERHADLVRCIPQCADCCHAVFGLFPVEAAYLRLHFDQLDRIKVKHRFCFFVIAKLDMISG